MTQEIGLAGEVGAILMQQLRDVAPFGAAGRIVAFKGDGVGIGTRSSTRA